MLLNLKKIVALVILLITLSIAPAFAASSPPDRILLTPELLQERLKLPIVQNGMQVLDLRRFIIDLQPENADFRDRFYRSVQTYLNRPGKPTHLDLSDSLIKGRFEGDRLGLRVPLYGDALSRLFTLPELEQLRRDRSRISQLKSLSNLLLDEKQINPDSNLQITVFRGQLKLVKTRFADTANFNNIFFLDRIDAQGSIFEKDSDWSETRFSQPISLTAAKFVNAARFRNSIFFNKARFAQSIFTGITIFQGSTFEDTTNFHQAQFQKIANFSRTKWQGNADFSQTNWQDQAQFFKAKFSQSLFLSESTFSSTVTFREAQFQKSVNLRGTSILGLADFSDVGFGRSVFLNISDLTFDSDKAKISGDPGHIGRALSIPTLQGNENLLRNLVRNFRTQEQISEANEIIYKMALLWQQELRHRLHGMNINTVSGDKLQKIGFSPAQVEAILRRREKQLFSTLNEILNLDEVDLATYVKVRDRLIVSDPISLWIWVKIASDLLGLSVLLWLSGNGTNFWLVFGDGLLAIAYFSTLFWLVDRYRRRIPKPIVPTLAETLWMGGSYCLFNLLGLLAIFRTSPQPWLTLTCLFIVLVPIPLTLTIVLYWRGRYHDLMQVSYFVEDASMRQLRLTIGRLPTMPRYPFFRERYMPILGDRNWNWLNYYDLSLNNLFKFGFNDIRLRDEHLPGLITSLVWYQWTLGFLYITLLLWTLSRTIPGLNLLIYLK